MEEIWNKSDLKSTAIIQRDLTNCIQSMSSDPCQDSGVLKLAGLSHVLELY